MPIGIYKPGQGYWTRLMTAIALGMLVLMGGTWISQQVANVRLFGLETVWTQALAFLIIAAAFGIVGYHLVGRKPGSVEFLIAVEGEMKKVNWSSRREIAGSTYVVIGFVIIIGLIAFTFDSIFQWLFIQGGVLEYPG
jgi:preprotein translocase subunit SecE